MTQQNHRWNDKDGKIMEDTEREILKLINEEESHKDKAYLLIMYKMFQELKQNTHSTVRIEEELTKQVSAFNKHIREGEITLGAIKGGWRVILVSITIGGSLLGIIQFLGYRILDAHIQANIADSIQITANTKRIYDLEKELYLLKENVKDISNDHKSMLPGFRLFPIMPKK